MSEKVNVFWFRRDLRLKDNAGLYHALKAGMEVIPIFIFDTDILDKLSSRSDARVQFIHESLETLNQELRSYNAELQVFKGEPLDQFKRLEKSYNVNAVYTNKDYEPYALKRDQLVGDFLHSNNIDFHTFKDHVIMEHDEVLKNDGKPYTVFTPYKRKWLSEIAKDVYDIAKSKYLKSYPCKNYLGNYCKTLKPSMPSLQDLGFTSSSISFPNKTVPRAKIKSYEANRNFPALNGTSLLGIHFRFGTISIREKARAAVKLSDVYLSELIWRDFYSQILRHFPHVEKRPFRAKYEAILWRNDEAEFEAWCKGLTGYPLVDAGMRELNATGHMHNRVRMVVASFLTKHLLLDYRWGEAYFAEKLLDFELASNNGGWQWAAGCGTDAAPYFRIFNPTTQLQKFDKDLRYVCKWIPEYGTDAYPPPIVDHKMARERCLNTYKIALNQN